MLVDIETDVADTWPVRSLSLEARKVRKQRFRAVWVTVWVSENAEPAGYLDRKVQELAGTKVILVDRLEQPTDHWKSKEFCCGMAEDHKCRFRIRWRLDLARQLVDIQTLHAHDHTEQKLRTVDPVTDEARSLIRELRHGGIVNTTSPVVTPTAKTRQIQRKAVSGKRANRGLTDNNDATCVIPKKFTSSTTTTTRKRIRREIHSIYDTLPPSEWSNHTQRSTTTNTLGRPPLRPFSRFFQHVFHVFTN